MIVGTAVSTNFVGTTLAIAVVSTTLAGTAVPTTLAGTVVGRSPKDYIRLQGGGGSTKRINQNTGQGCV